jgi:hypothetical protein
MKVFQAATVRLQRGITWIHVHTCWIHSGRGSCKTSAARARHRNHALRIVLIAVACQSQSIQPRQLYCLLEYLAILDWFALKLGIGGPVGFDLRLYLIRWRQPFA